MEVSACSDGQKMAAINTYLSINGKRQENVGQMTLAAANGSLSFLAHGCGDSFLKAEVRPLSGCYPQRDFPRMLFDFVILMEHLPCRLQA